MSLAWYEAVVIAALIVLGLWASTRNRRKPMATWKRRAFRDYGDTPMSDDRSSIDTFKRMHRY